jgi:hypothetical protein
VAADEHRRGFAVAPAPVFWDGLLRRARYLAGWRDSDRGLVAHPYERFEDRGCPSVSGRRECRGAARAADYGETRVGSHRPFLDGEPPPARGSTAVRQESSRRVVPCAVDLAPRDAECALCAQGFHPLGIGKGNRIVMQDPPPEKALPGQDGRFDWSRPASVALAASAGRVSVIALLHTGP